MNLIGGGSKGTAITGTTYPNLSNLMPDNGMIDFLLPDSYSYSNSLAGGRAILLRAG